MTIWVIIAVLLGLGTVLLVAPVRLIGSWEASRVELWVAALGMRRKIWDRDLAVPTPAKPPGQKKHAPSAEPDPVRSTLAIWENRETLSRTARVTVRFLRRLWRSWQLESGHVIVSVGTGNPAGTGMAHGVLSALGGAVASRWPQLRIDSRPDFEGMTLGSRGRLVFRFRLLDPLWHFVRYVFTLPWRGLVRLKRELALERA